MYFYATNLWAGTPYQNNVSVYNRSAQPQQTAFQPSVLLPQQQVYPAVSNLTNQLNTYTYQPAHYNGNFGPRHFYQPNEGNVGVISAQNNRQVSNQALLNSAINGMSQNQPMRSTSDNGWRTSRNDIMLYGDPSMSRIVAMRPSTMQQVGNIPLPGENIYSADHITDDKSYVMARGSDFIHVLTRNPVGEFKHTDTIALPFHPRTGAKNQTLGLELITGTDKPMFALIDYTRDQLVHAGGLYQNAELASDDYGSGKSTGHGVWLNDSQFVLPDRANHLLQLYHVESVNGQWKVTYQDSIKTNTSIHTIIPSRQDNTYYTTMEGRATEGVTAGLGELILNNNHININRVANISRENLEKQGSHHPELHPNGIHVYLPSAEGKVHVVDTRTMEVVKSIDAGNGAGHVTFIPERNLALVVNHKDTFVTAINSQNHSVIKNIPVAIDIPTYDAALQAHTGRVSPDKQYYYNFATDSGTFFRINLDTLTVDAQYYTGGTPGQASQPGELTYNT